MTAPVTPYTKYLGDREPLAAMRSTIERIGALAGAWPAEKFERSYQAGKWSGRQVLTHLAQTELALGWRARMVATTPRFAAQPFDQEAWIGLDSGLSGQQALDAFLTIARMNLSFYERLSRTQRDVSFTHPEYGTLTIDWIIHMMAGHQVNHLLQLEQVV